MKPITPVQHIDTTVSVPGSKSLTQRALIASALASGDSQLLGPLASEDTRYTIAALAAMGLLVDTSDPDCWRVAGTGGQHRNAGYGYFFGQQRHGHAFSHLAGSTRPWHGSASPAASVWPSGPSCPCSRPCTAGGRTSSARPAPAARP